jgi:hypothetical protein
MFNDLHEEGARFEIIGGERKREKYTKVGKIAMARPNLET